MNPMHDRSDRSDRSDRFDRPDRPDRPDRDAFETINGRKDDRGFEDFGDMNGPNRQQTNPLVGPKPKNVFEAIRKYGHDEDFEGNEGDDWKSTDSPAGSAEKIEVLRQRIERGDKLWHDDDRSDYTGLTGAIRPRD